MSNRLRTWVGAASLLGLIGAFPHGTASAVSSPDDAVFISELHYDNDGTDVGEAIEVFGPTCTDLTGWTIELYNGSNGSLYGTIPLSGVIPDGGDGFGTVAAEQAGIQNGSPDGLALIDATGAVRQFFSYEGTFVPTGGSAAGLTPTELPDGLPDVTAVGDSLQLQGTGVTYGDFAWTSGTANFGGFGLMTPDGVGGDPASCAVPPIRINELHYDNGGANNGADLNEAVEVLAPAGTDLAGWNIVLYNGSATQRNVYDTFALSGVVADQGDGSGVITVTTPGIQNGGPDGLALVDPDGGVVEFLSYEGSFVAADGPAAGMTSNDMGVAETGSTLPDQSLQRSDTGSWVGPLCNSFGELNDPDADQFCPVPAAKLPIYEIQGDGLASAHDGVVVEIDGVVVGDFQDSGQLNGFYVQEPEGDGNDATSDGIFVFEGGSTVDVAVGDLVTVVGTVDEFNGLTEITSVTSVVVGGTASLPEPTEVVLPVSSEVLFEPFEGMYVTFPQDLVISEYFNFDRFNEIVLTLDRQVQPTATVNPGQAAIDLAAKQGLERIMLDDGRSGQNLDPAIHPNGDPFTLQNRFRGGDLVTNATGVMDYSFNLYRIQPTQGADYRAVNERPVEHDPVGGNLEVASFNVLNYFHTIDSGPDICGPAQNQECRGADNEVERERQLAKIVAAMDTIDADVLGIIEVENTAGVEAMADIVNRLNDINGAGTYAYVDTGTIGTDAIKVGFIYQPGRATPVGDYAILDSTVDERFDDTKNRPALAQTFVSNEGSLVTVAVNHLKSKGSDCNDVNDPDLGDGAGNCNITRTLAAAALADWMESDPTGTGVEASLIIGDLNAYDKEDPIDALIAAGYTDLVFEFNGEDAYSYVFDGKIGYLDHALADQLLEPRVTGTTIWHINADEPDLIDYDTSFKQAAQDAIYAPDPYRSSDHDPVIVGAQYDIDDIIGDLTDIVADLRASGDLNRGQANGLTRKLDQALVQIERGNINSAQDILGGVADQLADFVDDGTLTPAQVAAVLASISAASNNL